MEDSKKERYAEDITKGRYKDMHKEWKKSRMEDRKICIKNGRYHWKICMHKERKIGR